MLSFQDQYTLAQNMAQDNTDATLPFLKQQINLGQRDLEHEIGSYVAEDTRTGTTSTSTNIVSLPENFIRLKAFYTTSGGVRYVGAEVYNEDEWQNYFTSSTSVTSDFLSRVFVRRNTIELYPKPASALTWTMIYEMASKDLSNADYSTGTISSVSTVTVTGTGTPAWTASMAGRYIQFTGDSQWYEIASVTSSTVLVLKTAYAGPLVAFTTYKIGELPRTPGPTHIIPVYYALMNYFGGIKKDSSFQKMYSDMWQKERQWAKSTYGNRYSQKVITPSSIQGRGAFQRNPNYYPISIG